MTERSTIQAPMPAPSKSMWRDLLHGVPEDSSLPNSRHWFVAFRGFVWRATANYWPHVTLAISGIILGFKSDIHDKVLWSIHVPLVALCSITAAIGTVASSIATAKRQLTAQATEKRLSTAELQRSQDADRIRALTIVIQQTSHGYFQLLHGLLEAAMRELNLDDHDRITLFKRDRSDFMRVARVSQHDDWATASERSIYPGTEGVIAKAWKDGRCAVVGLPAGKDRIKYLNAQVKRGFIRRPTARTLRMPTRAYMAISIKHPVTREKLGVLCFESTDPQAFDRKSQKIEELARTHIAPQVAIAMTLLQQFEPATADAETEGL